MTLRAGALSTRLVAVLTVSLTIGAAPQPAPIPSVGESQPLE